MELKHTELATVGGVVADILDEQGRLVITPNAVSLEGQRNIPADLRPGENLADFLGRHIPGVESGAWLVAISGHSVPQKMWSRIYPKDAQIITCRPSVGKQVVAIVAVAILAYFTLGASLVASGATLGASMAAGMGITMGAAGLAALNMGIFMVGSTLINKVLGPRAPKLASSAAARQVYSLSNQRNATRPYEALPTLWGEMKVTPDLASNPYSWYEGGDQYLSTMLLGGVNVHTAADLFIGDTPITSYTDVSLYYNGFSGMGNQDVPMYSNVDVITGAELENNGPWITRTTSNGTIVVQVDIEGQLYDIDNKGGTKINTVPLQIETRPVGGAWVTALDTVLRSSSQDVIRQSHSITVVNGQHEVRVRLGQPLYNEGNGKDLCKFAWTILRSVQSDDTDYSGWGRIGLKIKASGQLSGGLDTLRVTYRAKPMSFWNGIDWVVATTRENGLSNPGAILLQTLRGIYHAGKLQFGYGLPDTQIDIEGLKAFMLHCSAKGYTYDRWLTEDITLGAFCQEVALAGMGEFAWTDGSRPTAVFVSSGQPRDGVINMANMLKGSFNLAYTLSNAADGIEYQYVDRDRSWETQTLRVAAPGVTTVLNPATITGEGVTTAAHAAVMARYHLAQSLFQYKSIDFTADIEHLSYRRLSVLSLSHDLTQWGFGGRVISASTVADKVVIQLDQPVPPMAEAWVGLRVPGERDYRVFKVQALTVESDQLTLVEAWPSDLAFPGDTADNPAYDTLWCYDFKATPGYRVRVVGIEPEPDLKGAQVTCVPEGPEFWDYVLNGTYTPAPNQSSLPELGRPSVSNLRITEQVNVQGDTEWYQLEAVWDVAGAYDHAQVWAGRDGGQLRLVDGNVLGSRSTFRIEAAGEWLIEVRPFNSSGLAGQSTTVLYITTLTQLPPRNVNDFVVQNTSGLRKFSWLYTGDRPPAFAGVQIRYKPGNVVLSVADWDSMTPIGEAGDIYTAQFETTQPPEGLWTFGCRAIDTAGQLANGIKSFSLSLTDSFGEVQEPDLTPPPTPTGLSAVGALASVMVSYAPPIYTVGHGHARTHIYAAVVPKVGPPPTFAQALQVAESYAGPESFASEPATTWMVWAKHESADKVLSTVPAGPVTVETGVDVSGLLEAIKGEITNDQFAPDVVETLRPIRSIRRLALDDEAIAQTMLDTIVTSAQGRVQIREETAVIANDVKSEAQKLTVLTAEFDTSTAQLEESLHVLATDQLAQSDRITNLDAKVDGNEAKLQESLVVIATDQSAQAQRITTLDVKVDGNQAIVQGNLEAIATEQSAQAQRITTLDVKVDGNQAIVQESITAVADDVSSQAQAITTLTAQVGDNQSAIQTEATVRADETGHLAAAYSVKMALSQGGKTVAGGFAITGKSSATEGPTIDFGILANKFYVAAPAGSTGVSDILPFYVQTTPTTINGVAIPVGVYMDSAFISNVTVLWGRFGTLVADSIQATSISASQLTLGNGTVGGNLRSSNYITGSTGWILQPNGVAEFSGVVVRGTIYATAGTIGGILINANGLNSGAFTGYSWPTSGTGFHLGPNGLMMGSTNTGRYINITQQGDILAPGLEIVNGNAKFSGALSAASGTFAGTLTAQAINAVDTVNIAGNAVTVPGASAGSAYSATVPLTLTIAAPVVLIATFYGQTVSWFVGRILRNGMPVVTGTSFSSGGVNPTIPITISGMDNPGVGSHTYTVDGYFSDGSGTHSSATTLTVLGAKR